MYSVENITCDFCKSNNNDELRLGKLYTHNGLKAHYFCLLLSPNLYQSEEDCEGILGFMPTFIKKELKRAERLKCYICHERGASLGCCNKKCRKSFHLPCGIKQKCISQFYGHFESFCNDHSPVQEYSQYNSTKDSKSKKENTCGICCDKVNSVPEYDTVWTTCCRNGWFHRDCVMNLAKSSGYHFIKCPLCNNKEEFTREMQRMGIYIPDQDASWELEPHAFEDLLYTHNQCDSELCKCPSGRDYNKKNTIWSILLCKACGSAGSHRGCRATKGRFYCTLCDNVNNRYSTQFKRITRNSYYRSHGEDIDKILEYNEWSCSSRSSHSSNDSNHNFTEYGIEKPISEENMTPYILRSRSRKY